MKILQQGVPLEQRIYKFYCKACGTVYEVEYKELQSISVDNTTAHCKCPTCGRMNVYKWSV